MSDDIETMEVHIGKCCYTYCECSLCEYRPESLENLELHLVTCEIYECNECFIRVKHLSEIKEHIQTEHDKGKYLNHLKLDRKNASKVDFKHISIDKV